MMGSEYVGLDGGQSAILPLLHGKLIQQNHLKKVSCLVRLRTMLKKLDATIRILADHPVDLQILGVVAMDISALTSQVLHLTVKHLLELDSLLSKPMLASLTRCSNSSHFNRIKNTLNAKGQLFSCLR